MITQPENRNPRLRTNQASLDYGTPTWSAEDRRRLYELLHSGGTRAVLDAFADRRPAAVYSAIRRFRDQRPMGSPREPIDRYEIRARIQSLPAQQVWMRLAELLGRKD